MILLGIAVSAIQGSGLAQELPWGVVQEEPVWVHYAPRINFLKTDVELRKSSYKREGGATDDSNDLAILSGVGIEWRSYVYHPALLNYNVQFEPVYRWEKRSGTGNTGNTTELTLNGDAKLNLLAAKPFASSIAVGRSQTDVQADFFSSQTVDQQYWSLLSGYRAGAVPVTLSVEQRKTDRSGVGGEFVTDQFKVVLHAVNSREKGGKTTLDYQFNRYQNDSTSGSRVYSSTTSSHSLRVTDREVFEKSSLTSSAYLNERESRGATSTDLNGSVNYNLALRPGLTNYYNYSGGAHHNSGSNSLFNSVVAGLRHQLYESLTSDLSLRGTAMDSKSGAARLKSTGFGVVASMDYNKRLGDWGHLSINNSIFVDRNNQTSSGLELAIQDETYTLPSSGPLIIRLKNPTVLSVTSITKNNIPLDAGEWIAITTSDPWQIQFFNGGAQSIANGDTVLITYVVRPNPSGNRSTRTIVNGVGFRFWKSRAGVRATWQTTDDSADAAGFVVQNIRQIELGADVGWHGARLEGTYTNRNSTLNSYRGLTLVESYSRPLSRSSTLGVDFYQQWINYPAMEGPPASISRDFTYYNYMLHFEWHPTGTLSLNAEAGLQQQRGDLTDQDRIAARVFSDWKLGKLDVHLGLESQDNQYVRDEYRRHYAFLRVRREF